MTALAYVTCAFVWGTTWFAIRLSIESGGGGGFPTMQSAAMRFSIAGAILLSIWWLGGAKPTPSTRRQWRWLAIAGLFNGVGYALVYRAEEAIAGSVAAVLFGTFPLATALIATITKTEKVSATQLLGASVALGGIVTIFWDRLSVSIDQALGIAMMVGAVFCSASYGVVLKREAQGINPLAATTVFLSVTAVILWTLAPIHGEIAMPWPPPTVATLALLYLAIFGSVLTFVSYMFLLKRVTLMTTTTLVLVQPVIAIIVDALFERQVRLTGLTYVGMAIVLVGVFASLATRELGRRALRRSKAETAAPKSATNASS